MNHSFPMLAYHAHTQPSWMGLNARAIRRISRIGDGWFLVKLHRLFAVELVFAGHNILGRLTCEFDVHSVLFNRVSQLEFTKRCDFLRNIEVMRKLGAKN